MSTTTETPLRLTREALIKLLHHYQDEKDSAINYGEFHRHWGKGFHDGRIDVICHLLQMEGKHQ